MSEQFPVPAYLSGVTFVAFDTETTGLFAATNNIVEVGAVRFRLGQDNAETFQELVNPGRRIPADAIRVHGITDEMVALAEPAGPVLERFISFCRPESVLISHHAPFDISFIGCELNRAGLSFGDNPILDTIDIYRRLFPGLYSYSLLSLVTHFGISKSQEHRALSDAVFVRSLFERAAALFPSAGDLASLLAGFTAHRMNEWSGEKVDLPDTYSDLKLALDTKQCLEIIYESPVRGSETRRIWPERIYAQGQSIYVTAFCEKASAERTFRLDRIVDFKLLRADREP
ncbi:hypothetical protein C3F09_08860 [candidate division GN15 bacterium]|uniref:Exonuclease domain-containing protein n=1 Tax=candidate division GN15 bacterium TaxID=2072418 RepID=A0A855X540_9BACT|nr:MAG: hypothetical protein C3F09_08860 [candidate division GN15 bacterium]